MFNRPPTHGNPDSPVALLFDSATQKPLPALLVIIALTAGAMGSHNAIVRQLKASDLTTTVLTLTITAIASASRLAGHSVPDLVTHFSAVGVFFLGALVGALLVCHFGLVVPLVVSAATVLFGTLLCISHPRTAQPLRS